MRSSLFVLVAFASVSASAAPVYVCQEEILFPSDGATNVAVDSIPRVTTDTCSTRPVLTTAAGVDVPFTMRPWVAEPPCASCTELVPAAPFDPATDYVLSIGTPVSDRCGAQVTNEVRFHTAPRPALLRILVGSTYGEVHSLRLDFSEALDLPDLAAHPERITVAREDGAAMATVFEAHGDGALQTASLKSNATLPEAGTEFRVRVSKALKFVSGASLPADVDVVTAWGVADGVVLDECPANAAASFWGCSTGAVGLLALAGLVVRRRR